MRTGNRSAFAVPIGNDMNTLDHTLPGHWQNPAQRLHYKCRVADYAVNKYMPGRRTDWDLRNDDCDNG
jgi:hypothetical protein